MLAPALLGVTLALSFGARTLTAQAAELMELNRAGKWSDVVFMATTLVALYAFAASDGTLLWADTDGFGPQTGGMSGGYGYCMGPAASGDYVVAGALVASGTGGVLNVYSLG